MPAGPELETVEARIRGINPYAKLHKTERAQIALDAVLGRNAFDLDRILDLEPAFLEGDDHDHDHDHPIMATTMTMIMIMITTTATRTRIRMAGSSTITTRRCNRFR